MSRTGQIIYLEKGIELRFALVEELLVDGFEGKFAEGGQLQFLQRRETLRGTDAHRRNL